MKLHVLTPVELRTDKNNVEWAHTAHPDTVFPFTCRCCPTTFQSAAEMEAETKTKSDLAAHQTSHYGQHHHKPPLCGLISISNMVPDILHFLLRVVQQQLDCTVLKLMKTEADVAAVMACLKEKVGCYIKVKKQSKNIAVKKEKKPNLIGRECKHLLKLFRAVLLTVLTETSKQFKDSVQAWEALEQLWNELVTPIQEGETRQQKADRVQQLAKTYTKAFVNAVSADKCTLYTHAAYQHFPQMILDHGDLLDFAGEGLENLHTTISATGTNKRKCSESNTRGRTYQAFEQVAVSHSLDELVPAQKDMRAQRDLASKLLKRKSD